MKNRLEVSMKKEEIKNCDNCIHKDVCVELLSTLLDIAAGKSIYNRVTAHTLGKNINCQYFISTFPKEENNNE